MVARTARTVLPVSSTGRDATAEQTTHERCKMEDTEWTRPETEWTRPERVAGTDGTAAWGHYDRAEDLIMQAETALARQMDDRAGNLAALASAHLAAAIFRNQR
jgi:hypothetical protein